MSGGSKTVIDSQTKTAECSEGVKGVWGARQRTVHGKVKDRRGNVFTWA